MNNLLTDGPRVINIGLDMFADDLERNGTPVARVAWQPPASRDPRVLSALARLDAQMEHIEAANAATVDRMLAADPVLVDVVPAGSVIDSLGDRRILHAGPPVAWADMCGPMRGAIAGAIVFEGWADNLDEATALAASGAIDFEPNHDHGAVGPMTGMTTRSMPVLVVENRAFGNRAYCTVNEGLGKVMRFGGNDASVIERLHWLAGEFAPVLAAALAECGGLPLKPIVARGLSMGDEMHQRNVACTSVTVRELAPAFARAGRDGQAVADALAFMSGNDQFFLNLAMVMGKAITDPARDIPGSTIVTAMCRNGTDFGVRVSGTGAEWYTAPVEMPRGLYFPGFSEADANPDMGDSTIVETVGLGGFAMAAAPAVAGFVGAGRASDAAAYTQRMRAITTCPNPEWTIPALDFAGVPTGIDVRKVVTTGIAPTINTGIAHKEPGIGQVGAGVVNAPLGCFEQALVALADALEAGKGHAS